MIGEIEESGFQGYSIGGATYTKADLKVLYDREEDLRLRITRSTADGRRVADLKQSLIPAFTKNRRNRSRPLCCQRKRKLGNTPPPRAIRKRLLVRQEVWTFETDCGFRRILD